MSPLPRNESGDQDVPSNPLYKTLSLSESDTLEGDSKGFRENGQYGSLAEMGIPSDEQPHRLSFTEERALLWDETTKMLKLALPVMATCFSQMIPGVITVVLVGRMAEEEPMMEDENGWEENELGDGGNVSMKKIHLDAAALAVMLVNIMALSTGLGLLSAMDTLCSQAHGANQSSKMGTFLLTGMAIIGVVFFIVTILVFNTTKILLFLGQPPLVAHHAGDFARWMFTGVPFVYAYELLKKLSQARSEVHPMLVSTAVSLTVNILCGYYFVNFTEWGYLGAALGYSLGKFASFPALILGMVWCGDSIDNTDPYTEKNDKEFLLHVWEGFRPREALTRKAVLQFLELGVPGMFQIMFESVAFEITALLCGILPVHSEALIAIGANSIVMSIASSAFMFYLGLATAGNVRVGNALGAGDVHRACVASYLTIGGAVCLSVTNIIFLLSMRTKLPYYFTDDLEQADKAKSVLVIAAIFQLPDSIQTACQGVLRACGRQALAAKLNFVAYYVIGIPIGYLLGVSHGFGVEGLWLGLTIGLFSIASAMATIVLRSDWKLLSLQAKKRLSLH